MLNKIQQGIALVNAGKFKKALPIFKKINAKSNQRTYTTLELEAICLLKEEKYYLAELAGQKSLNFATKDIDKCNTLMNLRTAAYFQGHITQTIEYIKQLLSLDGSIKYAEQRLQLCQLLFDEKRFSEVIDFTAGLYGLTDYFLSGTILAIRAFCHLERQNEVVSLLSKIKPVIAQLTPQQTVQLVSDLLLLQDRALAADLLNSLQTKYLGEQWFEEQQKRVLKEHSNAVNDVEKVNIPQERIIGDDPVAVGIISKLIELLEDRGAKFHHSLRFIEADGELSIKSYLNEDVKTQLIQVPLSSMPMLCDYQLSVEKNNLQAKLVDKPINPSAAPIMALMVELYNSSNKLEKWYSSFPLLALKEFPEFVELLVKHHLGSQKIANFKALFDNQNWYELLLESFIGSREFKYKKTKLAKAKIATSNDSENGLLAIIDFLNHQQRGSSYEINNHSVMEINSIPDPVTHEVFVQYNLLDPLKAYLVYGFVDTQAKFLFSLKSNHSLLSGLQFEILNTPAYAPKEIVLNDVHLREYLPAAIRRRGKKITVSHIVIPNSQFADKLPEVLENIIKKCDVDGLYNDQRVLDAEIANLEKLIILDNLKYWQMIKKEFERISIKESSIPLNVNKDVTTLYSNAISRLNQYMSKRKICLM